MNARKPKYHKDVLGDMAERLYDSSIRAKVDPEYIGRFIAIDVESGDYEVADSIRDATAILHQRRPEAQTFCRRIGPDSAVTHFYGFNAASFTP